MKAEDILSAVLRRYEELLAGTDTGVRTLAEAQRLSGKLGKSLGRILAEELLRAFPEGAVSEEAAMAVIPPALRKNSDVVSGFVREIQKRLNEAARVPAPTGSRFRAERAENLARYAAGQESFESAADTFSQLVETNSRMVVDDAVRDQAKAHYGMGLSPKIIRKAAPGCCDWCTAHAGTVAYGPGMDKEIFRRHKNCPCLIEYDPDKGAKNRERVENYRFSKEIDPQEAESRKQWAMESVRLITSPVDLRIWPDGEEPPLQVGRNAGAAFKDVIVELPDGSKTRLAPGTRIERIRTIAGYGRERGIDEIDGLVLRYPGAEKELWMKKKGLGYVIFEGENEHAEIHWYEHPKVGRVKYKVKPDAGGNWFLEEE